MTIKNVYFIFQREFADSLKEDSLPMYQHMLSECHVLLRGHLTQATPSCSVDVVSTLQDNCFSLADSLCAYPTSKGAVAMATRYLILSGMTTREGCVMYERECLRMDIGRVVE